MRLPILLSALVILAGCTSKPTATANYDIIPLPQSIEAQAPGAKGFILKPSTKITYPEGDTVLRRNAELLAQYAKQMIRMDLEVTDKPQKSNAIVLSATLSNENPEAYELTVTSKLITINGASAAGNFYGIQTLRKSMPAMQGCIVEFPPVVIADQPRFAYRGTHFDTARHFFPADSVKEYIDILALHNINRFHWHLTDDQGWHIEIKSRPELVEKGSVRKGTMIGTDFSSNDSISHGGYYTHEQVRDIVKYAADRHITIIPEIDMPGHMQGALCAYPELGCTGGPYEVWMRWGVSNDVLCAGNDSTYAFIEDVLDEIADLFPSELIHIGGDECPKARWQECPKCQAKIKELNLKTDKSSTAEQKLQSHFMKHASDYLAKKGRRIIGWDEILEGGAAPGATIMSWRGTKGSIAAAKSGHDAILTPVQYCYFDYVQADSTDEQLLSYATLLPVEKVYSFEPIDTTLTADEAKHILGAQANLWCEYIPTLNYAEYKLLPRLAAMSEVQWCEPERKNLDQFMKRLKHMAEIYDAEGYNYAKFAFTQKDAQ